MGTYNVVQNGRTNVSPNVQNSPLIAVARDSGQGTRRQRGPLSDEEKQWLREAHSLKMSQSAAGIYAGGVPRSSVQAFWSEEGLKPHYNKELSEEQKRMALEANARGMNATETAIYANGDREAVTKFILSQGFSMPITRTRTDEEKQRLLQEGYDLDMKPKEMAEHADVTPQVAIRWMKKNGLMPHYAQFPQSEKGKIIRTEIIRAIGGEGNANAPMEVRAIVNAVVKSVPFRTRRKTVVAEIEGLCAMDGKNKTHTLLIETDGRYIVNPRFVSLSRSRRRE